MSLKSGTENFRHNSVSLDYSLLDFWKWSSSDLLSNALRGRLAEFIVAMAMGMDINKPRREWDSYDLLADKIRIEVKSAAYVQSWHQDKPSKISFSIRPARYWDPETNIYSTEKGLQANIYVMCLLKHTDKETIEPLELSQWGFYVVSASELDRYATGQKTISLAKVQRIAREIAFSELKSQITMKSAEAS